MKIHIAMLAAALTVLVSACAGGQKVNRTEIYERHAGESVNAIPTVRLREWRPLNQDTLIVRTRQDDWFLLDLSLPCAGNLRSAIRLAVPGRGRVGQLTVFDHLLVDGRRCRIMNIRPLDYAGAQQELERVRAEATEAAEQ